mgnify:CR=1 FL=1
MKEVRKLITDLAFNYYEHGSKLDTIIPEADIDPIIKYIGDNFVSRVELPVKPANGGLREQLIIALASNSASIKYDWRIKERDADFITKEKIIFAEDSAKMIIKFAEAILKENDSRLSV